MSLFVCCFLIVKIPGKIDFDGRFVCLGWRGLVLLEARVPIPLQYSRLAIQPNCIEGGIEPCDAKIQSSNTALLKEL